MAIPSESSTDTRETAPGFGTAFAVLRPRKAGPFFGRHPWVFDSAIERIEGEAADGDVVELVSEKRKFIARGILNAQSRLRVRLYSWDAGQPLDESFWRMRLQRAIALRHRLGLDDAAQAARLVFSEADGISGLVVDRYGRHLVVQLNSLAMATRRELVVKLLVELLQPESITFRSESGIGKAEGMESPQGPAYGELPDGPVFIDEHGLRYGVDLATGQKTGFYLDQRDNRRAAAAYFAGRRVLDVFCFTGAFSLAASRLGEAQEVLGIDSSDRAIALARANAELNSVPNVRFEQQDCFQALDELRASGRRFDAVILDPPKFTRTRQSVNEALRAYHRINRLAVEMLEADGILVTCSCSGSVTREDFLLMLSGVAQKSGREIQVLEQRGAAPDHPVSATCLETEYLKCFICRVL
ncbi:MAG: class I SAM-dependent rRNA methyltransferase [Planctomycetes bacterium]|nr:class I SAM-dependent rRNA methyltransferase [Planctomycetota bacterium]